MRDDPVAVTQCDGNVTAVGDVNGVGKCVLVLVFTEILGNRNYLGFGSVIGSPLFGRPWGALPGRSLRVWLNFRR